MLRKIETTEFEELVEFAYEVSQDLSKTSFPVYTDGIKTKQDFLLRSRDGIQREGEEILVFQKNGQVEGWVHYFTIPSAKYIVMCNMSIRSGYAEAFAELLEYWKQEYPGYLWSVYFPEENQEIAAFMKEHHYEEKSREIVDVLAFQDYEKKEDNGHVVEIQQNNFSVFREIHQPHEQGMYWTSERIENTLDNWAIYAYKENDQYIGAVYYNGKGSQNLEIFGIDLLPEVDNPNVIRELLISALNGAKDAGANSMYFFNDESTHEIAKKVGFRCVTTAHYYEERMTEKN